MRENMTYFVFAYHHGKIQQCLLSNMFQLNNCPSSKYSECIIGWCMKAISVKITI